VDVIGLLRTSAFLPLRTAAFGIKATTTVAATSMDLAAATAGAAVATGIELVTEPIRQATRVSSAVETAVRVGLENVGGPPARRCHYGSDRAWIEVCGLRDTPGSELGDAVLAAVR
jgi:hypothetical protein